ncbi:MAG TPA: hypothetical protein VIG24_07580 [Acidimicrobiia bacterium]
MSRYASKRELVDVIRQTIATDHNRTGLPTDVGAYNFAGVLRDLDIIGDPMYGYTTRECGSEMFARALRNNLRRGV